MRAWVLVLISLWASQAFARGRLVRPLDGLAVPAVSSLAQDARGFVWIGSVGGLQRYDGQEVRRIAPDLLATSIVWIRAVPDGSLIVADAGGAVFAVSGEAASPVLGPDGTPLVGIDDIWVDAAGALWTVGDHAIRRRDAAGRWSEPLGRLPDARIVRSGADGTLYVASRSQVWRVDGARVSVVAHAERIIDVLPATDGNLYVLESHGHLWRAVGGTMIEVFYIDTRAITLAQRGRVIWMVCDSALVAIRDDAPPEVLGRSAGVVGGQAILVDTEGSLWLGSYAGVQQFPEPDTAIWDVADGLPAFPRYVVETAEGIRVPTWSGLGRIDPRTGTATTTDRNVRGGVCVDDQGRLWGADTHAFIVRVDGKFVEYPAEHPLPNPCHTGPSGRVWFAFRDGVYATRRTGPPELVAPPPATPDTLDAVHEDRHGRVWVSARDLVCAARLDAPITVDAWRCQHIAGAVAVADFEETEAGTLWAATEQGGVRRWNEAAATWEPVDASLHLASRAILGLAPSPRGGMWVLGHGIVLRVRERQDLAGGWEVLEAPSAWNGLPAVDALDALETRDGTLWIAGIGTYQIPASVRVAVPHAPRLTESPTFASTASTRVPMSCSISRTSATSCSSRSPRCRIAIRRGFAIACVSRAMSRGPSRSGSPRSTLADIGAGGHIVELAASLDGAAWSGSLRVTFEVHGPLWREPWAIAALVAVLAAIALIVVRVRTAMQLRLERQRVHIAMDLHDEMGSGLGLDRDPRRGRRPRRDHRRRRGSRRSARRHRVVAPARLEHARRPRGAHPRAREPAVARRRRAARDRVAVTRPAGRDVARGGPQPAARVLRGVAQRRAARERAHRHARARPRRSPALAIVDRRRRRRHVRRR